MLRLVFGFSNKKNVLIFSVQDFGWHSFIAMIFWEEARWILLKNNTMNFWDSPASLIDWSAASLLIYNIFHVLQSCILYS